MKETLYKLILMVVITLCYNVTLPAQKSPRSRESFNDNWKFIKNFNSSEDPVNTDKEPAGLEMPSFADNTWRTVDLPHDWAIEGPFSDTLENFTALLPWKGIGWYRKHFTVNESDKDNRFYIDFDGAMAYSKVWLNGKFVGEWPYGYTSFRLDLTPYIKIGGENIIAVRLDTKKWDSRWYPGAGIYRNVWLVKTRQVHIAHYGVFCTTPEINKEKGTVSVNAEVESHLNGPIPVTVKTEIFKLNEMLVSSAYPVAESTPATATLMEMDKHSFSTIL